MSERLTDEQLRCEMQRIERDNDIAALRARVAKLEAALEEVDRRLGTPGYPLDCRRIVKAALKDAPPSAWRQAPGAGRLA
jgi:hypothetical protein